MRVKTTKTKNTLQYSIIKDIIKNEKRTTCVYENLGTIAKIKKRAEDLDPLEWLKEYVKQLNIQEKEKNLPIIIQKKPNKIIEKDIRTNFNIGYLFLQKIYYELKLDKMCEHISVKHRFKYDLNDILSKLIYARIIFPASKRKTLMLSKGFLEQPNFDYHHIEKSLFVFNKYMDYIQSEVYKNSKVYSKRNDKILYYDCTNYYFEISQEDELRKYGKSKENRPNPIIQMGLFMDGDGIPLAFSITPGNQNEQLTLKPLEKKILSDFKNSEFIVCTDAGLASIENKKYNNIQGRKFITTQSIKKLKHYLKKDILDLTKDWYLPNDDRKYDISNLRTDENLKEKYKNTTFYKERWINENGLEQRLIVTFSVKYQEYQKNIREGQIKRAQKIIESNPRKIGKPKANDPKRFIETSTITSDGEVADINIYSLNQSLIDQEAEYDGLYAITTNLEDPVEDIIKVNSRRWQIEENFKIMKSDFKSRPAFHHLEETIKAHFLTCFLALIVYRYLEKILDNKYTISEILDTIKHMYIKQENSYSYSPNYIRSDLTDLLHEKFGFRTDYEIMDLKYLNKILKSTKQ